MASQAETVEQQIKDAVTKATVSTLLEGQWLTKEVLQLMVRDAQEQVMVRVMESLTPDLRAMAGDVRSELRKVVLTRFKSIITSTEVV